MNETPDELPEEQKQPSKTRLKKESAAFQDLAAELAELSAVQLEQMELPENIFTSIIEAANMPHRGARKRLLKYVGGLLRKMDVEPIREKMARKRNQNKHASRELHKVEHWRDRLLTQGDDALTALLNEYPQADQRQIRQLIRNANKEAQSDKPPKSARLLFKNLRTLFDQS